MEMPTRHRIKRVRPTLCALQRFLIVSVEGVLDKSVEGVLDKVDMTRFRGDKIKIANKHVRFYDKVGHGGVCGNQGTSKVGAGRRIGGKGDEYNEQAGGQGRRIEEGDRNGGRTHRRSPEEWWELQSGELREIGLTICRFRI